MGGVAVNPNLPDRGGTDRQRLSNLYCHGLHSRVGYRVFRRCQLQLHSKGEGGQREIFQIRDHSRTNAVTETYGAEYRVGNTRGDIDRHIHLVGRSCFE
jgi:hypothetical protein